MPTIASARIQAGSTVRKTLEDVRQEDLDLGPPMVLGQPFEKDGPSSIHRHISLGTVCEVNKGDRMPCYAACPEQVEAALQASQELHNPNGDADRAGCGRQEP